MKLKKILIIAICLIFGANGIALAGSKSVYFEFSKDEYSKNYGPKSGFDWAVNNQWGLTLTHQFEAGNNEPYSYTEVRYMFSKQFILAINYETHPSNDSTGIKLSTFQTIKPKLWFDGLISYNLYTTKGAEADTPDYQAANIYGGLQYQVNGPILGLVSCQWTDYNYNKNTETLPDLNGVAQEPINPDSTQLQLSAGLVYQINQTWGITGKYYWTNIKCEDKEADKLWGSVKDKFVISSSYTFGKYNMYFEYPFPQNGNIAKIGVAYNF